MAPHAAPGTVCPYPDCQGLIPDLWAEWSADLLGVARGTTAIDCYYCGRFILYQGASALGGNLVQGSSTATTQVRRSFADMLTYFGGDAGKLDAMLANLGQQGYLMKNRPGKRAFEGYNWT
jgi:hypothetical protein